MEPTFVSGSADDVDILLIFEFNVGLGLDEDGGSMGCEGVDIGGSLTPYDTGGGVERLLKQFLHIHED